jgi:flagellar motor switch protein FliG
VKKRRKDSAVDFTVGDSIEDNRSKKNLPEQPDRGLFPEFQKRGGVQKAARLLLALGVEEASRILREMREDEIRVLVEEMSRIRYITAEEKKRILEEFHSAIPPEAPVEGGAEAARRILVRSFGEAKADEMIGRMQRQDARRQFDFLTAYEPSLIASVLSQEHPQIAAVTLSYMKPSLAAQVFKYMSDELRMDLCTRIGRSARISPEAVVRAAKSLQEKFEKRMDETYSDTGGAETLAGILSHLDRGTEERILEQLEKSEPDLFERVRERLYTFEELVNLDAKELRLLLSQIDTDTIAAALRGASDELRRAFFNSLSQNRASDVLDEMDHRGPISVREINESRSFILQTARRLDEEGRILIKKERDEYI